MRMKNLRSPYVAANLSSTLLRPTQTVKIFRNIFAPPNIFVWKCCRKTRKIPNEIYILSETSKQHKKEIVVSEHEISTICKIINISKTMQDSPKTQMCHCANSYHRERSRLLVSSSHTIRLPQYGPNRPPKRHILAWFHVFWAIACKNSSTGLTCARAWEKKV